MPHAFKIRILHNAFDFPFCLLLFVFFFDEFDFGFSFSWLCNVFSSRLHIYSSLMCIITTEIWNKKTKGQNIRKKATKKVRFFYCCAVGRSCCNDRVAIADSVFWFLLFFTIYMNVWVLHFYIYVYLASTMSRERDVAAAAKKQQKRTTKQEQEARKSRRPKTYSHVVYYVHVELLVC